MPYTDFTHLSDEQREHIQHALAELKLLGPILQHITQMPVEDWTPEIFDIVSRLKELMPAIALMKAQIGNSLMFQTTAIYYHIEKLAKEGNAEAQKVYENLRPTYLAALKENIDNAAN